MTNQAQALADALNAVLDHSGARGTYRALKYADAVDAAEALLASFDAGSQKMDPVTVEQAEAAIRSLGSQS